MECIHMSQMRESPTPVRRYVALRFVGRQYMSLVTQLAPESGRERMDYEGC
jgi:hypothetical protein